MKTSDSRKEKVLKRQGQDTGSPMSILVVEDHEVACSPGRAGRFVPQRSSPLACFDHNEDASAGADTNRFCHKFCLYQTTAAVCHACCPRLPCKKNLRGRSKTTCGKPEILARVIALL